MAIGHALITCLGQALCHSCSSPWWNSQPWGEHKYTQSKDEETEALGNYIVCGHRASNYREIIKIHAQNYVVLLIARILLMTTKMIPKIMLYQLWSEILYIIYHIYLWYITILLHIYTMYGTSKYASIGHILYMPYCVWHITIHILYSIYYMAIYYTCQLWTQNTREWSRRVALF